LEDDITQYSAKNENNQKQMPSKVGLKKCKFAKINKSQKRKREQSLGKSNRAKRSKQMHE